MRISDWSSDVCSPDLRLHDGLDHACVQARDFQQFLEQSAHRIDDALQAIDRRLLRRRGIALQRADEQVHGVQRLAQAIPDRGQEPALALGGRTGLRGLRSEENTSELQSLMRISYAVFCLKKKTTHQ